MKNLFFLFLFFSFATVASAQKIKLRYDHYAIQVKDLTESANFYMNVVGLKEITNGTGKANIRWFGLGKNEELHVIENKDFELQVEKGVHLAIRVKNLDSYVEHLRSKSQYFETWQGKPDDINVRPDGIRQVYFQDPNGYWIEVNGK